jgi:hypothetical protein
LHNPGTGARLGVNCADPYVASLNGSQVGWARVDVNLHEEFSIPTRIQHHGRLDLQAPAGHSVDLDPP